MDWLALGSEINIAAVPSYALSLLLHPFLPCSVLWQHPILVGSWFPVGGTRRRSGHGKDKSRAPVPFQAPSPFCVVGSGNVPPSISTAPVSQPLSSWDPTLAPQTQTGPAAPGFPAPHQPWLVPFTVSAPLQIIASLVSNYLS